MTHPQKPILPPTIRGLSTTSTSSSQKAQLGPNEIKEIQSAKQQFTTKPVDLKMATQSLQKADISEFEQNYIEDLANLDCPRFEYYMDNLLSVITEVQNQSRTLEHAKYKNNYEYHNTREFHEYEEASQNKLSEIQSQILRDTSNPTWLDVGHGYAFDSKDSPQSFDCTSVSLSPKPKRKTAASPSRNDETTIRPSTVITGSILDVKGSFNLITDFYGAMLYDPNPVKILEHCHKSLNNDGYLVVKVSHFPNMVLKDDGKLCKQIDWIQEQIKNGRIKGFSVEHDIINGLILRKTDETFSTQKELNMLVSLGKCEGMAGTNLPEPLYVHEEIS